MELMERTQASENRLRLQQQKSFRSEQCLLLQIFKVQRDNKGLRQQADQSKEDMALLTAKCRSVEDQLKSSMSQVSLHPAVVYFYRHLPNCIREMKIQSILLSKSSPFYCLNPVQFTV